MILDDLAARELGRSLGLEIVGTGAVLYKAKLKGLLPRRAPGTRRTPGLRLSTEPEVYRTHLSAAGEAE